MADNLKPLVIKVQAKSVPNGVQHKWNDITQAMPTFTKDIVTPPIDDKDGKGSAQIGAIVSGMPTIFARANMFKLALNYISDKNEAASGLMSFYKALVDEWRGFIGCLALDYANVKSERIYLTYTDGGDLATTGNVYEPKGAFGNMLFERKPLWCDQGLAKNEEKKPFIEVITYKGNVVGGTSPESFLFTSVAYKLDDHQPFIGVQSGKFTDPLGSELSQEQLLQLHGYVSHILSSVGKFLEYYKDVDQKIKLEASNINSNLENWKREMEQYAAQKGYKMAGSAAPPVDVFKKPFSTLFNFSSELYGEEGVIYDEDNGSGHLIQFDPRKLLLDKHSEIARIEYGNDAARNPEFLKTNPIYLLKANVLGMADTYYYFALPLSPLGLNVFGKNLAALVGIDNNTAVRSNLTASFDPASSSDNLKVKLQLVTQNGKENTLEEVYSVGQGAIRGHDVLIWPNFISRQWKRYFLYSEMPHNTSSQTCPFKATPFVGDVNSVNFGILMDENEKPIYLSENGAISNTAKKHEDQVKAKLHIISDNRVADNQYKYEIYESNQPFKGVRLTNADRESGYVIIRYSSAMNGLPIDGLNTLKDLGEATLGIDFGSTNTSVAYFSKRMNRVADTITFKNRRVSLFGYDKTDNNARPAVEAEIFFFQNEEIQGNAIKSILTIHDTKRLVEEGMSTNQSMLVSQAVKGGFPCFEKNLPIESVSDHRYRLQYNRSGVAEIVHDMKWSNQNLENAYKTAYLSSLLLHIYAQLFEENHVPTILKWSYPSSMGFNLIRKYEEIWSRLNEVCPVVDIENPQSQKYKLTVRNAKPSPIIGTNSMSWNTNGQTSNGWGAAPQTGAWGTMPQQQAGGWGQPQQPQQQAGGWGQPQQPQQQAGGWGQQAAAQQPQMVDIKLDNGPIKFNFTNLGGDECLTEACAVANYIANQNMISTTPDTLTLCFDVGGSTTDISALCCMMGPSGPSLAMVKQNSIRFAAQRVSNATRYSKNIKDVLIEMCDRKKMRVQGLNTPPFKFSPDMAPYYFDQILDRLEEPDFPIFYQLISGKCPELMSVNIYVTGLIMYYAGQLAYKLIAEIKRSEDKHPVISDTWRPTVNVMFAGKGSRIFDWFNAVDSNSASQYYQQQFILGFGGQQNAMNSLFGPPIINPTSNQGVNNVKYEVSKGLAYPTSSLLVPHNTDAIEILGEEGFVILTAQGQRQPVPYDSSVTPEMMENIGMYFMNSPTPGMPPCPKFMDFSMIFYQVATQMFGLNMSQQDFINGFSSMNINNYIKTLPEYYEAVELKKNNPQAPFDFVAPIIILEGMKFYDEFLMQGIQK